MAYNPRGPAYPYPAGDWNIEDSEPVDGIKVIAVFGGKHIQRLFVIAEMWDRVHTFSGRRKYHEAFSEKERRVIERYRPKIYMWYCRTGIPRTGVAMKPRTYEILARAADFFASLN